MREETSMYEWDEAKRRSNQIKHDVDFKVIEAFDWDTALINASHHGGELRFVAIGYIGTRLHVIVYTQRGDRKRIISLRKASNRERARYAQA